MGWSDDTLRFLWVFCWIPYDLVIAMGFRHGPNRNVDDFPSEKKNSTPFRDGIFQFAMLVMMYFGRWMPLMARKLAHENQGRTHS